MLNFNKSLKRVYTNKLRYFLFKIKHLAMQAACTNICERASSSNELAKQEVPFATSHLWNLFILDISWSTVSDCKTEDFRKRRHSDQSSWQKNRSRSSSAEGHDAQKPSLLCWLSNCRAPNILLHWHQHTNCAPGTLCYVFPWLSSCCGDPGLLPVILCYCYVT